MKKFLQIAITIIGLLFLLSPFIPYIFGPKHSCIDDECIRIFSYEMDAVGMCVLEFIKNALLVIGIVGGLSLFFIIYAIGKDNKTDGFILLGIVSFALCVVTWSFVLVQPGYMYSAIAETIIMIIGNIVLGISEVKCRNQIWG